MIVRPELLTHPNIPKPLHGVTPRSILGDEWWERVRQLAYQHNDYCCWACGVHKTDAKYHNWLEAHESYKIDYEIGRVELQEIVALCHSCHNFIHSGRMFHLVQNEKMSTEKFTDILLHGFDILKSVNLKPFAGTAFIWLISNGFVEREAKAIVLKQGMEFPCSPCRWDEWHLKIEHKLYFSPYADLDEWKEAYR